MLLRQGRLDVASAGVGAVNSGSRRAQAHPAIAAAARSRPRRAVARVVAMAGRGGPPPRFDCAGPQVVRTLPVVNAPLGPSPSDPSTMLELQLEVVAPSTGTACPVVIFTPGFLLNSSLYRSYAQQLASWGYTVVLWDLSEVLDDTLTLAYMRQLLDMLTRDARLAPSCDARQLLLMGHSRGAKLSCLLAAEEPRVKGLALLDPVDNSSFGPSGVGYPSSLPGLQRAAAARQLPVLVVGAALNSDVVPPEANWSRFTAAAAAGGSPVMEVVLKGSSHLQFLDKQMTMFSLFTTAGPTPDDVVRRVTQDLVVAFSQLASCPPSGAAYSSGQVQTLLAEEATAMERLAPLAASFANLSQLRTSAPEQQQQQQQQQAAGPCWAGGAASSSGSSGGGGSASRVPGAKPVTASRAQLSSMRVRELKRLLQEHGVASDDCFEKEALVNRVLERCTLAG